MLFEGKAEYSSGYKHYNQNGFNRSTVTFRVYQISTRLCKLDKVKSEFAGACSWLFLKLKSLNETSIKNPSYSGDQLIRIKSLQDTKLYFGVIYSSKRM